MKFREKSKVIEAIQFLPETVEEIKKFMGVDNLAIIKTEAWADPAEHLWFAIGTPEGGSRFVSQGDWVVKREDGFYPCSPQIFEQFYERIE